MAIKYNAVSWEDLVVHERGIITEALTLMRYTGDEVFWMWALLYSVSILYSIERIFRVLIL